VRCKGIRWCAANKKREESLPCVLGMRSNLAGSFLTGQWTLRDDAGAYRYCTQGKRWRGEARLCAIRLTRCPCAMTTAQTGPTAARRPRPAHAKGCSIARPQRVAAVGEPEAPTVGAGLTGQPPEMVEIWLPSRSWSVPLSVKIAHSVRSGLPAADGGAAGCGPSWSA